MAFLESIKLNGLLSFSPDAPALKLAPLNVLIGPNGSGKSNFIEALEVLRSAPDELASFIRQGGTATEWLWKGKPAAAHSSVEVLLQGTRSIRPLRYKLSFAPSQQRMEVVDEFLEEVEKRHGNEPDVLFFYRFQRGRPVLNVREGGGKNGKGYTQRKLKREDLVPDESVLSQRKDPDIYPEVTWVARQFSRIQIFRNWSFGRSAPLRSPHETGLQTDELLGNSDNLGLILNELQHSEASAEFNRLLTQFLPRYQRFSTRIHGNTAQFYLHERGLTTPVPATRLSDGTIRFMAILALLLSPTPPPLLCIEEPELGLHPDAVVLLADLLIDAANRMQLVVTTHSDALISALTDHAESVLVCENRGGTVVERIDSAKLTDWLDKYRLGEVWRMGELGGNP